MVRTLATDRRSMLRLSGSLVATAVTVGCSSVIPTVNNRNIELTATRPGWLGVAPPAIEAKTNPTIHLIPGATYELIWTNHDGRHHKLAIVDSDGNELKRTKAAKKKGDERTLGFDATPEHGSVSRQILSNDAAWHNRDEIIAIEPSELLHPVWRSLPVTYRPGHH